VRTAFVDDGQLTSDALHWYPGDPSRPVRRALR
jgi:hypothetical protein